jgi:hypothetical protein
MKAMSGEQNDELLPEFDSSVEELPESVDRAAIERMRVVATILDSSIRVPGTDYRIGADPLLGILPGPGDVLSGGISLYIVLEAARLGASYTTLLKMIANVSLDVAGGSIPIVGTVFDAVWKANERNMKLVLEDLTGDHDRSIENRGEKIEVEVE